MNQILFEMYIGVITNFQKEPDYGHQIPHYKVSVSYTHLRAHET